MGRRKPASPAAAAEEGTILSFFKSPATKPKGKALPARQPQPKKKHEKRAVPIRDKAKSISTEIIDLCSASEKEQPRKRIRLSPVSEAEEIAPTALDCTPPPPELDLGVGPSKLPFSERQLSPDWPDVLNDDEELVLSGNGLSGSHNPDWLDEDSLLKRHLEQEDEADSEQDDEDIIVLDDAPLGNCELPIADKKGKGKMNITDITDAFSLPSTRIAPKMCSGKMPPPQKPTAFTALMSGHAEDKAWKAAAITERTKFTNRKGEIRKAPFYKVMEGMPLAVDAFRYGKIPGIKAYFLSHAHSDHYTNLSGSWCAGPVYCSKTTANLIIMNLGVKPQYVKAIPYDTTISIAGVNVTMLDANHCPGSSLFLFEGSQTTPGSPYVNSPERIFRYLHCGDFRASPRHLLHPNMVGKCIDICYLDTTYCAPSHQFPAQEQVIQACADLIRERICEGNEGALRRGVQNGEANMKSEKLIKGWLGVNGAKKEEEFDDSVNKEDVKMECDVKAEVKAEPSVDEPQATAEVQPETKPDVKPNVKPDIKPRVQENILVLVGTYSIGKERIVKGIAKAIGSKIFCTDHKMKLLKCIDEDPELLSLLTDDPLAARVHLTGLFAITRDNLAEYLAGFKGHYTKIIGLRPTGWTFKPEGVKNKIPSVASTIGNTTHKNYSPAFLYPQRDSTEQLQAYGVPYSEHSSFRELTCFCVSMNHVRIIATVNVHSETSRAKMKSWFEKWQAERKRRKDAGEPEMVPYRTLDYW